MSVRLANPGELNEAEREIRAAPRLAVDTEFHAERRYLPRLYLVQVHTEGGHTWLLDPLVPGTLESLAEALRSVPWVVHGGFQDIRLLNEALGGLPARIQDTQIGAGLVAEGFPATYAALLRHHLDVHLSKTATLSDWSRRPLSPEQITYASEDVQLLLPLWDHISTELAERGRLHLAEAACEEARTAGAPDPDTAWRRFAGLPAMTRPQAAVLQELTAWREEWAMAANQPPRSVVSDGILGELARRQPITLESLSSNRRISRRVVSRHGAALLECIARALRRPEWGWPRHVANATPESRACRWLQCWSEAEGHRHSFSARLVLPRRLIEDLVLDSPTEREEISSHLGSWRDELVGDPLWRALRGGTALHLEDGDVAPAQR